jgi:hypothetical protein
LVVLSLILSTANPLPRAPRAQPHFDSLPPSPAAAKPTAAAPSPASSAPKSIVAIQESETLDFARDQPGLKASAEEKAIIEQSVKEMNEVTAGLTFGPAPKTAAPK